MNADLTKALQSNRRLGRVNTHCESESFPAAFQELSKALSMFFEEQRQVVAGQGVLR